MDSTSGGDAQGQKRKRSGSGEYLSGIIPPPHNPDVQPHYSQQQQQQQQQQQLPPPLQHHQQQQQQQQPLHLAINYLARQFNDDLPLLSDHDALLDLLHLLNGYQGVLERKESLAWNLGAAPLGPILIKKFEKMFDGPPKVTKVYSSGAGTITWLDVVEFARNRKDQFIPRVTEDGNRVYQFDMKDCQVQISEEDHRLIDSGLPYRAIPPQPIAEDEEKELGTLDVLESRLTSVIHLADQVAARARQINHRLKGRKQAIIERRRTESSISGASAMRASSPSNVALMNGSANSMGISQQGPEYSSPTRRNASGHQFSQLQTPEGTRLADPRAVSQSTREELSKAFFTMSDRRARDHSSTGEEHFQPPRGAAGQPPFWSHGQHVRNSSFDDLSPLVNFNASPSNPVAIPATPTSLLPSSRPSPDKRDDGGTFRLEMMNRLEKMNKGETVCPPCDRCRRLRMPCEKNLTACVGCTKKHAKCTWKDVTEEEMRNASLHISSAHRQSDTSTEDDSSRVQRNVDAYTNVVEQLEHSRAHSGHLESGDPPLDAHHTLARAAMDRSFDFVNEQTGPQPPHSDISPVNDLLRSPGENREPVIEPQSTADPRVIPNSTNQAAQSFKNVS